MGWSFSMTPFVVILVMIVLVGMRRTNGRSFLRVGNGWFEQVKNVRIRRRREKLTAWTKS